jgi:FlaA1/EpsC-like NDP-sugar epimerase
MTQFKNRTVLVTGAGGSIGTHLCRIIVSQNARELRLLSVSENALYNVERSLRREYQKYRDTKLVPILGSACDDQLLHESLADVDVIIHAAAHKHVPLCEANPFEAITNNVGSAWTLMWAAFRARVPQLCVISTDKAVNAKSVMGATKRLSEIMLQDVPRADVFTDCFVVRFGNVMDSAGSVLPLWREQLAAGEPITLTHELCERYFMSIEQAAGLVCDVVALKPRGGTYVLDMGKPVSLKSLAEQMLKSARSAMPIQIIGLRPGEKLTEELHFGGELHQTAVAKVFRVQETNHRPRVTRDDIENLLTLSALRSPQALPLLWRLIGGQHG